MIEFSNSKYIPQLKKLWNEVFGDEEKYLNSFFSHMYSNDNTLIWLEDDKVVAMLYIIPYDMIIDNKKVPIMYLYALATNPDYRGIGIMSKLIEKAHSLGQSRGYTFSALIPASLKLFNYYKKFDYQTFFFKTKLTLSHEDLINISPIDIYETNIDSLWDLYITSKFYNENSIILNKDQFIFSINSISDKKCSAYTSKNDEYAIYYYENSNLNIIQTTLTKNNLLPFLKAMHNIKSFDQVIVHDPLFPYDKTITEPYAMAKIFRDDFLFEELSPYIGMVLI